MVGHTGKWGWLAGLGAVVVAGGASLAGAAPAAWPAYDAVLVLDDAAITEIRVADFNQDDHADLLTVAPADQRVAWWDTADLGRRELTAGSYGIELASPGDFNGDGCDDVLTFEPATKMLRVWRGGVTGGVCTGAFARVDQLVLSTGPFQYVTAGELTGDYQADYLMAEADDVRPPADFMFARNNGGPLTGFSFYMGAIDQGARRLKAADLDADGCADVAGETGAEVGWWRRYKDGGTCRASPTGSFANRSAIGSADAAAARFEDVAVADLDDDGRPDVAALMTYEAGNGDRHSRVYAWPNTGGGQFGERATLWDTSVWDEATEWRSLDAGDLDRDGDVDLAVTEPGYGVWALVRGSSPWVQVTPTTTATSAPPTDTPTATDTVAPATGTPTATNLAPTDTPVPTTATPTATPVPATDTPTPTATPRTPGPTQPTPPCAGWSEVLLVAPAANATEGQVLGAALAEHALAWQAATGHTLKFQVQVFDGGQTYSQWLAAQLASGFRDFCAGRVVAVVGDNDLSRHYPRFGNLGPWLDAGPPLPAFLPFAWAQTHMPDSAGAPYALPWLRDGCSESYRNLALVAGTGDPAAAYDLLRFLVSEPRQRVNFDAQDPATRARLAFPTLRQPYEAGWSDGGAKVTCDTVPPADVPDPVLVEEAVREARNTAARLAPLMRDPYRIERFSFGPDTDNVVYDTIDRTGTGDFIASSAVALTVKAPLSPEQAAEYMAGGGLIVGQISFYAPGGQALTPTPAPTRQPAPTARPGASGMFLPGLLKHARFLEPPPGSDPPFKGYAVLWRLEAGARKAWLVRPDGSLAGAADVARDLGLAAGDIEFEEVRPSGEPRLGAAVWAETGSKKNCWGIDGLEWCMKKKK